MGFKSGDIIELPAVEIRYINLQIEFGVFAAKRFEPGELIERAPVIQVYIKDLVNCANIEKRVFAWGSLCGLNKDMHALPTGCGTLYNHADRPNATWAAEPYRQCIVFEACEEISVGEQITIDYDRPKGVTEGPKLGEDWFSRHRIQKRSL